MRTAEIPRVGHVGPRVCVALTGPHQSSYRISANQGQGFVQAPEASIVNVYELFAGRASERCLADGLKGRASRLGLVEVVGAGQAVFLDGQDSFCDADSDELRPGRVTFLSLFLNGNRFVVVRVDNVDFHDRDGFLKSTGVNEKVRPEGRTELFVGF